MKCNVTARYQYFTRGTSGVSGEWRLEHRYRVEERNPACCHLSPSPLLSLSTSVSTELRLPASRPEPDPLASQRKRERERERELELLFSCLLAAWLSSPVTSDHNTLINITSMIYLNPTQHFNIVLTFSDLSTL